MNRSKKNGAGSGGQEDAPLGASSGVLLVLLAVLPAAFATGLSNFEALKELLLIGGIGVALVMWGVAALRRGRLVLAPARVAILGVIFGLYALSATLWAGDKLWGLWEALHFVALAVALLITVAPSGRAIRFRDLALASGVGALGAGICGILDLAGVGIFTPVWDPAGPTGAFDAMEFGAAYYVVVLPIIWGGALGSRGFRRVFLAISFFISIFHFALLSGWIWAGIFAVVSVFSAIVVGALRRPQSLRVLIPAIALSVIVGVLAAGVYIGFGATPAPGAATQLPRLTRVNPPTADQLAYDVLPGDDLLFSADRAESVRSLQAHSYLLSVGATLISQKPLIGSGAGAWWPKQSEFPHEDHDYIAGEFEFYPAFRSPHNAATKLLVEYGAVGFLLFSLWILALFSVALSGLMKRGEKDDGEDSDGEKDTQKAAQKAASTCWVVEHWAMLAAALAGLVFMLFTPLLSLAPAALSWVLALGVLARVSAEYNNFSGWSSAGQVGSVEDGTLKDGSSRNTRALNIYASLATLIGLGILVPTALNASATFYRGQGDRWMLSADYQRAIDAYKSADQWYPAAGDVPLNIGLASARLGRLEEASEWVERAAKMRPYDVRALTLKGRLLLRDPDPSEAVGLGNQAVAAFPNSFAARNLLIAALALQQRYDEAVEQAEAMIAREPPAYERAELEKLIAEMQSEFLKNPAKAKVHYEQASKYTESAAMRERLEQRIEKMEASIQAHRQRLDDGLDRDAVEDDVEDELEEDAP